MKLRLLALLASLSLGCGSVYVQHHVFGPTGAPHNRAVRAILDGERVPPAIPVALVQAIGRGSGADLSQLVEGLRDEARRLGCDGVVQVRIARAQSTATAVGIAVRWTSRPQGVARVEPAVGAAPWAPPPPLPAEPAPTPDAGASAPPWSAR